MMRMSETGVPASRASVWSQAGYDGVRHSADLCARRNRRRRGSTRRRRAGCPPAATGPNVPRPTAGRRFHRYPRPDSTRLPQAALPLAIALDGDHRLGDPVDQLLFLLRGKDVLDDVDRYHGHVVLLSVTRLGLQMADDPTETSASVQPDVEAGRPAAPVVPCAASSPPFISASQTEWCCCAQPSSTSPVTMPSKTPSLPSVPR
jgi:hypothetical protein